MRFLRFLRLLRFSFLPMTPTPRGLDAGGEEGSALLRVDLMNAKMGMRLALPVQNPRNPNRALLKVGYELNEEIVQKLRAHEVRSLYVQYPSLDFLDKVISPELVKNQQAMLSHIADTFEQVQKGSAAKIPYDRYTNSIEQLIEHMLSNPQAAVFLGDIDHTDDDLMRHSSAVAYLSLLLGLKLEGYLIRERKHVDPTRAKEVRSLGLGAMLHDVGALTLPEAVRQRFFTTGDESDAEWREHPVQGWRMVRGKIDASAAAVILHHHQRVDGTGYAGKDMPILEDKRIHVFARIVALADAFDRLRNPAGGQPRPTVWALSLLLRPEVRAKFDPQALQTLFEIAPPYAPGLTVKLSDGRYAVVIDHNPDMPCRPKVQIVPNPADMTPDDNAGEQIDLREVSKSLHVVEAEGFDVSELNFQPPGAMTVKRRAA